MHPSELCVHRRTLPNGLRVVCVPQPNLHGASISLHVRVGSRFETISTNGRSHALEHMLYRGTPTFATAHDQALALERLGGTLFAATHAAHGLVAVSIPPVNLSPVMAIFGEVIRTPTMSDWEVERGIIREEILEALDERGRDVDPDNLSRALMFGTHGLGLPIAGSLESLANIEPTHLQQHHARHYTGANCVLGFAGAIDPQLCFELAEQHLGLLPSGAWVECVESVASQDAPRFQYVENQSSQTDLRVAFHAPGERAAEEPAAEVLIRLLDDGMSTRVYARICDEKGLCYDASADYETFEDVGVLDLAAAVQHRRAPLVLDELCDIVRELALHGPGEEELRVCKQRHRWETEAVLDDAEGLADFHGRSVLCQLRDSLQQRDDQIAAVTRDDVVQTARSIFCPARLNVVAVGLLSRGELRDVRESIDRFGSCGRDGSA